MPVDAPIPEDDSLDIDLSLPIEDGPPARLVIERLAGVTLTGWAYHPQAPGQERLTLLCGERRFELAVRRQSRRDVTQALGVAGDPVLGFEFDWPLDAWKAVAESGETPTVLIEGSGVTTPLPWRLHAPALRDWINELKQSADAERAEAEIARLQPHLEQAHFWAGEASGPAAATAMPGNVEGWRGLVITGWLADKPDARQPLRLRCGDRRYEVPLRRVSRQDVAARLKLAHEDVGFEIEVPGSLWRDAPDAVSLTLQVEARGAPLGSEYTLTHADLPARLDEALALADSLQRAHQALQAMEHLAWAGQLEEIEGDTRDALAVLAESAGVGGWLRGTPASLAARLSTAERVRTPFRLAARGRLGKWLQSPANGQRALKMLAWLRSRSKTAGTALRLEATLTRAIGLFDKACYDEQISPEARGGMPAVRHYVEQGDARSLMPMWLFDARHYTGQLEGRRHPGVNRLLHYALVGRHEGLSPCAWFDPAYYLSANADVRSGSADPLTHFVNWGWKERRRPSARFQPTAGTSQGLLQRLMLINHNDDAPPIDPLMRYLLDGLPPDAQSHEPDRLPWSVPARMGGRDYLELAPWQDLPRRTREPKIDVVVPVYAGAQETLRCLWSVLSARVQTPFELVVVDDCSPEPALSAHLRALADMGLILLRVNEKNRGFVASVNRGLKLHWDRDVVILNSDTRVHPGWLDRLAAHGEAEPRAASVTPMSNNATVCSYPRPLHSNWERLELDDAALDELAAVANRGRHVEVPTGVGFCMWMRRAALDAIGLLDVKRFGRGYGEENDWCMRANAGGWVQLVASDVYVLHQGAVSFSAESSERTRAGIATLLERHPDYQRRIDDWIARDPLLPERARLDAARLKRAAEAQPDGGLVLMVNHARGGGTARHEAEEARRLRAERGWGVVTMHPSRRRGCISLSTPSGVVGGRAVALDLPALQALPLHSVTPAVSNTLADDEPLPPGQALLDALSALNLREVQLHHLVDHPSELRELLPALCKTLGVPLSVTVHDYHLICPRINLVDASGRYCGEPDRETCNRCLARDDLVRTSGQIGPWRAAHSLLLKQAERVIVPDLDVASRLSNYFPTIRVQVQPHEALVIPHDRPPKTMVKHVLVIGALSPIKGLNVLLGMARSAAAAELGLRFTLLGHSSDDDALRAAGVNVLGRYDDITLASRIAEIAPDMILLPSVWPETFCYVLTQAAASGRRVAVFDLGAQARRLREAHADATYLPIELANQPEVLSRLVAAPVR